VATGALRFPALAPPESVMFDPDAGAPGSHAVILRAISDLELAAVGGEAAALVRFLLLKRLASSPAALARSIHRLCQYHRDFLEALAEGLLLKPSRVASGGRTPDYNQLELRRMTLRPVPPDVDVARIGIQARNDLVRLEMIVAQLSRSHASHDGKVMRLRELAFQRLRGEKLLVFTEFRDTASYLWNQLRGCGGVALIHGDGAWLGAGPAGRSAVIRRFAPVASGAPRVHMREQVRILIATDVMAEGLNLQDCGHVVSYDLPWNPVRLMQRLGRIDRLGSPHDFIHVYNFLPDHQLDEYLRLLRRLGTKLRFIDMAVGTDRHVLEDCAFVNDARVEAHAPVQDVEIFAGRDERLRRWLRGQQSEPPANGDSGIPFVLVRSRLAKREPVLCVFTTDTDVTVRAFLRTPGSNTEVDPADVVDELIRTRDGVRLNVEAFRRYARWCRSLLLQYDRDDATSDIAVRFPTHRSPARLLSRRLMAGVAAVAGGPSAAQCSQADRLIAELGSSHDTVTQRGLARIAAAPDLTFDQVVASLDELLAPGTFCAATLDSRGERGERSADTATRSIVAAVCMLPEEMATSSEA
jgi:hypothetical protein